MNTEDRQHLKTNDFGQAIQVIGHRMEEHAAKIVVAICAILAVSAAIVWWSRQVSSTTVSAWSLLESAQTIDDYGTVADKYKSSLAGRWAKLRESEMHLQAGMTNTLSDRELALSDLKRAKEGFELLAAEKPSDPIIRERALWGLALSLETTSDGDTSKAIEAYQKLLNEVPETIFKPVAENRITELKTGGSKEFYAWFAKQNPKPVENRPKDGLIKGDADSAPPGPSDFSPNPPKSDDKPVGEDAKKTEATSSEKAPAETPVKPDDGAPAAKSEEPKSDKPNTEEAKPEEKPATDSSKAESKDPAPKN